jgi:uncharacterized protein (TIGR02679 family)
VDVLCDEVSSRVLVLNLPLAGEAHIARVCRESFGDPVWISLRSLTGDWSAATPSVVFVCENPTVVEAAADALGRDCPPVVCTDGIATSAALDLVAGLVAGGCSLRIRADFDDAGLVIIGQLLSVAPAAELWRFDAKTYLTSIRSEDAMGDSAGLSVPNALDELRTAQGERGIAVHEEALLDDLLDDLRQSASAHSGQRG